MWLLVMPKKILVTYEGITDSVSGHAKRLGISKDKALRRYNKGWPLEKVFSEENFLNDDRPSQRRYISCDGETLSLQEWAKRLGVEVNVILARIDRGWTEQEAVSTPKQGKGSARLLTYQGETLPINGWAKKLGMNFSTIHLRVEAGWPIEDILSTEKFSSGRIIQYCKVEGCGRRAAKKFEGVEIDAGYCFRHHRRFILWGDPLKSKADFRYTTEFRDGKMRNSLLWQKYESAKRNAKKTGVSFDFEDYHDFYNALGDCPEGKILSRRDFDKGYNRNNCFWDTASSHARRRSRWYWDSRKAN